MILFLTILGLHPSHHFSWYFPLAVLLIWLLFLPLAYFRHITIFYNASLKAAFGEEFVFRGVIYGAVAYFFHSPLLALIISSLLFGLVHMRNIWWAGWRRSWSTSVYAGFTGGPLFGFIRLFSGDIYLGILVHFLHNLWVMFPLPGFNQNVARTPTNDELRSRSR